MPRSATSLAVLRVCIAAHCNMTDPPGVYGVVTFLRLSAGCCCEPEMGPVAFCRGKRQICGSSRRRTSGLANSKVTGFASPAPGFDRIASPFVFSWRLLAAPRRM